MAIAVQGNMASIISKFRQTLKAFKEKMLSSTRELVDDFSDYDSRKIRYSILWAFYENSAYRTIHAWATAYKTQFALYKWLRNLRNPAHTIGNFMADHVFAGILDNEAGTGGAIPIETDNENLRPAIAELWKWSQWWRNKDLLVLLGTVLGDVGIRVVDDVEREKVYLEVIHPGHIKSVELDPFGSVKGYTYEEMRDNDIYTEVVSRDGDLVVYETFKNDSPFAWEPMGVQSWTNGYGFVPFVLIRHIDIGLDWGWSEFHPAASRIREIDELTSMLSDHLRKVIDPLWLMKQVPKPKTALSTTAATATQPEPGREEIRALWNAASDADATPLTTTLDIKAVVEHIDKIVASLEADFPELRPDLVTPGSSISGRALRIARQPLESKVQSRRQAYNTALIAANGMAIAIGGHRGYENYDGFGLDSYAAGQLEHNIAFRPVFTEDPADKAESSKLFWEAAGLAMDAGLPLSAYLKLQGWSDDKIAEVIESEEYQERRNLKNQALKGFGMIG